MRISYSIGAACAFIFDVGTMRDMVYMLADTVLVQFEAMLFLINYL